MLEQKKLSIITKLALLVFILLLSRYCVSQRCTKPMDLTQKTITH